MLGQSTGKNKVLNPGPHALERTRKHSTSFYIDKSNSKNSRA